MRVGSAGGMSVQGGGPTALGEVPAVAVVRASVDRVEASVVDVVRLTVEVTAPAGARVEGLVPAVEAGGMLGGFGVASVRREPGRLAEDGERVVHRWVAELEAGLPGVAEVPALSCVLGDGLSAGDASWVVVPSEAIVVEVRSLLEGVESFTPAMVPAPLDPVAVAATSGGIGWGVAVAGGLVCVALGAAGAMALRPTGARRVRRAFAELERTERRARRERDEVERARGLVGVLRGGLVLVVGARARSATAEELAALLGGVEGVPGEQVESVRRLAAWLEVRDYGCSGGGDGAPGPAEESDGAPATVEALQVLAALRRSALRAAVVRGGAGDGAKSPKAVGDVLRSGRGATATLGGRTT